MKKTAIVIFLFLAANITLHAQNGKIVEQKPYTFDDTTAIKIEKIIPDSRQILSLVDFYKIKYLSDGLKVTGYMAVPKKAGKYPCVIFNRGGNREFGALNPNSIMRYLGQVASWVGSPGTELEFAL